MYITLTILIVIASVLLTLLVLVQNSKGGGLSAGFSSSNQIMGVRKTTDFLEKATWALVIFVVVASITTVGFHSKVADATQSSEIKEQYQHAKETAPAAGPNMGGAAPAPKAPAAPAPAAK
jgi:preprotein translocase subunit SecG